MTGFIGIIVIISTNPTTRPSIVVDTPDSVCETVIIETRS